MPEIEKGPLVKQERIEVGSGRGWLAGKPRICETRLVLRDCWKDQTRARTPARPAGTGGRCCDLKPCVCGSEAPRRQAWASQRALEPGHARLAEANSAQQSIPVLRDPTRRPAGVELHPSLFVGNRSTLVRSHLSLRTYWPFYWPSLVPCC